MSDAAVMAILDRVRGDKQGECECCRDEPSVAVAAVPGVPMSIAWGQKCLEAGVAPMWVAFAQADVGAGRGACREMFDSWWLEWHDRTLAYFGVAEEEFWAAINAPEGNPV